MNRLRYEVQIMGRRVIATPLIIMLGVILSLVALQIFKLHSNRATNIDMLTASVEMLLPLAAAVVIATLVTQDAALELQLTLPTPYRQTAMRRVALVLGWTACVALVATTGIFATQLWRVPAQVQAWSTPQLWLAAQLVWLAPLLWLCGVSLVVTLLLRNPIASVSLLGGIWIIETFAANFFTVAWLHPFFLFPTTFTPWVDFWLTNRWELLMMGSILLPLGWLLLRNDEALLQSNSATSSAI